MSLTESIVEDAALTWFGELGYAIGHGPQMAPGEPAAERDAFGEVVLVGRLREAIRRLNPTIPVEAREEALRKVLPVGTPSLTQTNRAFHRMLRDGVDVSVRQADSSYRTHPVSLLDFTDPLSNDWLAVNQFTVIEGQPTGGRTSWSSSTACRSRPSSCWIPACPRASALPTRRRRKHHDRFVLPTVLPSRFVTGNRQVRAMVGPASGIPFCIR